MFFDTELIGLAFPLREITPFAIGHLSISLHPKRDDMRSGCKHRPHFLKRVLRFLIGVALAAALLIVPVNRASSSVLTIPKPLPDIVKKYKPLTVLAGIPGMHHSGIEVNQVDIITLFEKGTINIFPVQGNVNLNSYGPRGVLLFLLKKNDRLREEK